MVTRNILIIPAADCPVSKAARPPEKPARPTRAEIEFRLLTQAPYALDHRAFSHAVHTEMARNAGKPALDYETFHQKGQPCMRASPLTKRFGWAAHYNADGYLALIDPDSDAFHRLASDPDLPQKPAMRTKRV